MRSFAKCLCLTLLGFLFLSGSCFAYESKKGIQSLEFLSGFGKAKLRAKGDYIMIPFIVAINFNLKPLTEKIGINPASLLQFQLEPFISPVYEPNSNIEFGTGFILKIGFFPEASKIQPYIKAGPGMLFMSQHTREQATQFNFFQYAGVGAHYFLTEKTALTLEYRYRHLSNAGIKHPNSGINTQFALLGLAYRF